MHIQKYDSHLIFTLRLNNLRDLFLAPEPDPFAEEPFYSAGVDSIVQELRTRSMRETVQIRIQLPADAIEATTQIKARRALDRYCDQKLKEARQEQIALRWQALKALQTGIVFLAACLFLSAAGRSAEFLPQFWRDFLGESWLIAGWVGIWRPTELLLYEWWSPWRTHQIYQHLQAASLHVEAEEGTTAPANPFQR